MLYSAGSGVKRVHVVLSGLRMSCLFVSMYVFPVVIFEDMLLLCLCRSVLIPVYCSLMFSGGFLR